MVLYPLLQFSSIGTISPNLFHYWKPLRDPIQQQFRAITILDIGIMHYCP